MADANLPETMNPNHFPRKLWCMVNDPANIAIRWDITGEFIVIFQSLFEKLVLSQCGKDDESHFSYFKTTKFSSFFRQLNLYGFKKAEPLPLADSSDPIHHFFNPNFRRDNPALLINLKRLTVDNKAKIDRGIDVRCRPQRKPQRSMKGNCNRLLFTPHTYNNIQTPHTRAQDPSCHLAQGYNVPSLGHPYSPVPSSALQQGVTYGINYEAPNITAIHPQNEYNVTICFHIHVNLYCPFICPLKARQHVPLDMPNGLNVPFPSISYHWAHYPLNLGGDGPGPSLPNKNKEENHKTDVNLDRIFQMADELMLNQPNNNLIEIVSPEMHSSLPSQGVMGRSAVGTSADATVHR
ncbi:uncharacterized protein [Eucyclogobius newberryi]|uniref:uncharacterized protein n=1 Tax=Eucyclogobius newberryi TaxID=166745 RepID=UPI003B5BDFA1